MIKRRTKLDRVLLAGLILAGTAAFGAAAATSAPGRQASVPGGNGGVVWASFNRAGSSNWDIWSRSPAGALRNLTPDRFVESYPAVSPDGSRIAATYSGDLFVFPATGGAAVNLTNSRAVIQAPAWSPDGSQIAAGWAKTRTDNEIFTIPVGNPAGAVNLSNDVAAKVKGDDRYPDWVPV